MKQFSQACENNKAPILAVLREVFVNPGNVLEIGSGTGQHAVYMARHLPHLTWQPTDLWQNLASMRAWINEEGSMNILDPIQLDVACEPWPVEDVDGVFSANTAHIMSWAKVTCMIKGVGKLLAAGGSFCLYGPFNYQGQYTSDSNQRFDQYLRSVDSAQGIRDVEELDALARDVGFVLQADRAMPANNRTLIWRKVR
jgi:cyclopropane fatty-acyl-phospholipid synthase-like methyltransferase